MSGSYLFVIDKNYKGGALCEYPNSWLFSPSIWDVLEDKYLKEDEWGMKPRVIGVGTSAWGDINAIMNQSENTEERVCWELSNQQIFYTKDKDVIADNILLFIKNHKKYGQKDVVTKEKECLLTKEHIIERFKQISTDIKKLDETKFPYFVLKNTSCDDSVEYWFEYDEKKKREKTLKDWDELPVEFVHIENGKITGFTRVEKGNL